MSPLNTVKFVYTKFLTLPELKFIDDTTGFFIVFVVPGWSHKVYKIINDHVQAIGFCNGDLYHSFVVNRHTIYMSGFVRETMYNWLYISRHSDLQPKKQLLSTQFIVPDSTFYDTVYGLPLCKDLSEIHYLYKNLNDTVVYTFQFSFHPLGYLQQEYKPSVKLIPTFSSDYLKYIPDANESIRSIMVIDYLGRNKQYLIPRCLGVQLIDIRDLVQGVYFLLVEGVKDKCIYKFVKI